MKGRAIGAKRARKRAALRLDRLEDSIMSEPRWADELHSDSEDSPVEPACLFYANVDGFVPSYLLPTGGATPCTPGKIARRLQRTPSTIS
jgi:hypothetical protein